MTNAVVVECADTDLIIVNSAKDKRYLTAPKGQGLEFIKKLGLEHSIFQLELDYSLCN